MTPQQTREAVAEGIGTFMLVLVGAGAVAFSQGGVVTTALAHGLILIAIVATFGHISGAHVNPAVTLGLFVGGKVAFDKALRFWVAQFLGALAACVVLRIVLDGTEATQTLGQTLPASHVNALGIILVEGILTFFLVSTIYQVAVFGKGGAVAPLLIGFTLAGCFLFGAPLTGASLNPARTLGPALLAEEGQNLLEVGNYFLGIFLGGALAGFLHTDMFVPEETDTKTPKKRR